MNPCPRTNDRRVVDVVIGRGSVLRVAHVPDPDAGDTLVLSRGFGVPEERFHRPSWSGDPLVLPASILGDLRAALEALDDQRGP